MKHKNIHPTKFFSVLALPLLAFLLSACSSYKQTAYLQNVTEYTSLPHTELYQIKIQPFDRLYITAFNEGSPTVEAFNILENTSSANTLALRSRLSPVEYIVDENGCITLPLLGVTQVSGKTINELEDFISAELVKEHYRERPIVTVRFNHYEYSLLGEVMVPGVYYNEYDHLNIFEALAKAGDMTIYGMRDNVKVIRENEDGTKAIGTINLNQSDVFNSPYFYIQQNDVIYVQPNSAKAHNADIGSAANLWIRGASIFISVTALLFSIFR